MTHRYFVTGTDTDVGKTRAAAALAHAVGATGQNPTVVKVIQTGVSAGEEGDAACAARLASTPNGATIASIELARFAKPADPWSAAIAAGVPPLRAADLAVAIEAIQGAIVVEGSGGLAVPLNEHEHFGHIVSIAHLEVVLVVGLRLGCINHALLSLMLCEQLRLPLAGALLVERWGSTSADYHADVARALRGRIDILGVFPFSSNERASIEQGSRSFERLARGIRGASLQGIRE